MHVLEWFIAIIVRLPNQQVRKQKSGFFYLYRLQAPAAFGLVTFLLSEGLDRIRIRRHLLVFAAAAPVTAIVTFFGLSQQVGCD